MTVQSNYVIPIATLSDWPRKILCRCFNQRGNKNHNQLNLVNGSFSHSLSKLQVSAGTSDWFVVLFAPDVISWNNRAVFK